MLRSIRPKVLDLLTRTPLRHLARPTYAAAVAVEVTAERAGDLLRPGPEGAMPDVTVLIKTFERPYICARALASVRRSFPTVRVVVVDDSREARPWGGAHTVILPYDVGLSVGRNEGLKHVDTELFLLLDDDHIVSRGTTLERAVAFMRARTDVDIYAGQVFTLPLFDRRVKEHDRSCFGSPLRSIGGLPVYDRTDNFFVGRTRRIAAVGWEPRLKLAEHTEFFWRARGILTTVFDERFRVLHARTPFDSKYMRKRLDVARYLDLLDELMK